MQVLADGSRLVRLPRLLHGRQDDGHPLATPRGRSPRQDPAGQRTWGAGQVRPRLAGMQNGQVKRACFRWGEGSLKVRPTRWLPTASVLKIRSGDCFRNVTTILYATSHLRRGLRFNLFLEMVSVCICSFREDEPGVCTFILFARSCCFLWFSVSSFVLLVPCRFYMLLFCFLSDVLLRLGSVYYLAFVTTVGVALFSAFFFSPTELLNHCDWGAIRPLYLGIHYVFTVLGVRCLRSLWDCIWA